MSDWRRQRWQVGATLLEAGHGGIARVARMTSRTMIEAGAMTDVLSLLDDAPTEIAGRATTTARRNRLAFAAQCHAAALNHDWFLYDAVGPARAHPNMPGLKRPYGVWIHGVEVWNDLSPARARALRRADFVLVNSHFTLDTFRRVHWPLQNAFVCSLATEEDELPASSPKFDSRPSVLMIGRLDQDELYKGHSEMIQCWADVVRRIPDAQLIIAGSGTGLEHVRSLVKQSAAAANIHVLGFVQEMDLSRLWQEAHVFAMPSRNEGFGIVYAEAMRHGVPVVASQSDAGSEVNLDSVTGYNVDLSRPNELAERIGELLSDPDQCASMGRAGQARWRNCYRFSQFAERLTATLGAACAA